MRISRAVEHEINKGSILIAWSFSLVLNWVG